MRVPLAIAWLIVAGCAKNVNSFDAQYHRARSLLQAEQFDQALNTIDDALRSTERSPDAQVRWRFRLLKAEALLAQRRVSEVNAVLGDGPPDGAGWTEYRTRTLLLRGTAAYFLAHYSEAHDLLDRAATLAQRSGSASLAAEVELRQANVIVNQGKLAAAEPALRRAIRSASDLHDTALEAIATGSLGILLHAASRYDEAIVWFEKARELHTRLGANRSVARDALNLGSCYHRLGDYDRAQVYYEQARANFAKTGDLFDEQILVGNTGSLLQDEGKYGGATEAYRRAYDIALKVQNNDWASRWASSLAALTAELGDWNTAERYNNEAIRLSRQLQASLYEAPALSTAGRIAAGRGQFNEAERLFREAMKRPARDPRYTLVAQTELASLYESHSQPRRAEAEFQATVASIDRLNSGLIKDDYKFGYLASLMDFYRLYVDFLMAHSRSIQALQVVESSRSHVLAQRSGRPLAIKSHTAATYQKLARQTKAVLLEYWLGTNQSYLWVITPQRIRDYRLPPVKTIHELVEKYRNTVLGQRNPLETADDTGRKLYQVLLAPAAESICRNCRAIIVPDQDLYALNLESLPAGSEGGRFWIEDANVEIAPSLDYLVDVGQPAGQSRGKGVLVMGDPEPALSEYPKLEYAAREIDSIRASMRATEEKVLERSEARPDSYGNTQPGRYEFIHFSAHATANTQSPLDSAVILSGPPDRCKLFARDVMALPLTAELVTISACRSAGARTYAGEGLVGFAWAFLRAGAHNVIAGLWDVNDRSTAQLMTGLYAELARGSTPTDALRAAKLALIHGGGSYAKPYYWAPFQVYTGAAQ